MTALRRLIWLTLHLDSIAEGHHWRALLNFALDTHLEVQAAITDAPAHSSPAYCRHYGGGQPGFVP